MSRVFVRVETESGSRTLISNDFTARDATEIGRALASHGFEVAVSDEVIPHSYLHLIKRKKRLEAILARRNKNRVVPIRATDRK